MRKEVIKTDGESVKVLLNIIIKKEGDYYVAYCPALEVSSYGKTKKEAHKMFNEALEIFIEDTHSKGSFEKVLLQLGWKLQQKPVVKYTPPRMKETGIMEEIAIPL